MYFLIVFLPLLGFLLVGCFGRYFGTRGSGFLTTGCVFFSFLSTCFAWYEITQSGTLVTLRIAPWFQIGLFDAQWGFYFDTLSVVLGMVVLFISFLVHLYSLGYMEGDPHTPRFLAYLSLFTFFMLCLILSENFIQMFFGWEGVGCASYLLINFWFTRLQASKASIKAMLVNRVGDFGLALGIFTIYTHTGTLSFPVCFNLLPYYTESLGHFFFWHWNFIDLAALLLFIGAVGKSAQCGLHTWLPDAMEGPTPVSALIHAATMVTAGVFLLCRCSPLYQYSPLALFVVGVVGTITCFFAGSVGLVQNDCKRVIAYSTCSQLGYMVFACGIGMFGLAMFHLVNHAFFKALLFLSSGSVIHGIGDQQDIRKMGGFQQLLPFTYSMMLLGSLSLAGFPFLTGFYSKDTILEGNFAQHTTLAGWIFPLATITVACTSYYSARLLFSTFLWKTNALKPSFSQIHEPSWKMILPLVLLAFGSIFFGYFTKDMMIGIGSDFWGASLSILPSKERTLEAEYIGQGAKFLPFFGSLCGILLAWILSKSNLSSQTLFSMQRPFYWIFYQMLHQRWFFDKILNTYGVLGGLFFGYRVTFLTLDKGVFEMIGPFGIIAGTLSLARLTPSLNTGYIYHYALFMLCSVFGFLFFFLGTSSFERVFFEPQKHAIVLFFMTYLLLRRGQVTQG